MFICYRTLFLPVIRLLRITINNKKYDMIILLKVARNICKALLEIYKTIIIEKLQI